MNSRPLKDAATLNRSIQSNIATSEPLEPEEGVGGGVGVHVVVLAQLVRHHLLQSRELLAVARELLSDFLLQTK